MPYYDAGDAAIYYESHGEADSTLILLHGYALNGLMWELQIPVFVRRYRIITIDLRGFGKSSCGARWSQAILTEDILGILADLHIENAAILGFSMSGPVAFRVALTRPDRIGKLILASSILPPSGKAISPKNVEIINREIELLRQGGVELWATRTGILDGPLVANMFRRNPNIRQLWSSIIKRHNPDYLLAMMRGKVEEISDGNWRRRLWELKQPTLIIAGAQDSRFIDAAKFLKRNIEQSELKIIKGAGHMVNLEEPDEFAGAVVDFLG